MKSIHHFLLSIFLYILALLGAGLIALSENLMIPGAFIVFFCGSIGWHQWQMGEHGTGPLSMKRKKYRAAFQKIFGVILVVVSAGLLIKSGGDDSALIVIALFILIFGILEFRGSADRMYNKDTDGLMRIDSLEVPMDKIYEDFREIDTPLGRPWLTHVSSITDRDCIVWGPTGNDSYLFGYYLAGTFNFSSVGSMSWFRDREAAEKHRLKDVYTIPPSVKSAVLEDLLIRITVRMYEQMLRNYSETGQAAWPYPEFTGFSDAKVYVYDASFSWTGSVYHLLDTDRKPVFDITGRLPLTTFTMTDSITGQEIFKIKKDLTRVGLDQYEFTYKGMDFGKVKQEFDLYHDRFVLESSMGSIVLRSINATVGKNWVVLADDRIAGTISQNIKVTVRNMIFDNYVITCFDDKYLPVIAGLAIVGEREAVRDGNAMGISN